ncbi:MAG: low specificity L-threonine aldolase, partial [Gammaproteobacteria bacterium]|nr:low specificity L-threonine aldolase [Gammaproteobacteria bacterium]
MSLDFRSDTVTRPSEAMRKAMYRAEVGDDVYRDDKTINRLQDVMAERFGMEAGLFATSGTQANLV